MIGASPVPELTVEQVRDAIYAASPEGFDLAKCGVNESLLTDELNEVLRQAAGAGGGATEMPYAHHEHESGEHRADSKETSVASLGPDFDANVPRNPDFAKGERT